MSSHHGNRRMDRTILASASLEFSERRMDELVSGFQRLLDRGVHGLCFSAYLEGQGPELKTQLSEEQIRARMEIIRPYTKWVRTFSCTDGNERSPRIAHQLGLKTLVGAWLGEDRESNEKEIAKLIEIGRAGHADMVAVGNEALLREDLTEAEVIGYLRRVKQALPGIPAGYVDAYYLFCEHPALIEACDVVFINCYPFWEKCSLERSIEYMKEMYRRVAEVASGRKVVISETGWPSAGSAVGGATPSFENALLYALNTFAWTEREKIEIFYFSAFDEEWKSGPEGDCGPFWGFWDRYGKHKYDGRPARRGTASVHA